MNIPEAEEKKRSTTPKILPPQKELAFQNYLNTINQKRTDSNLGLIEKKNQF